MFLILFVIVIVLLFATARQVEEFSWVTMLIRAIIFIAVMAFIYQHRY
jgi:NADH:ubiquinone oxidoreductase subunit 3 (subunit A)